MAAGFLMLFPTRFFYVMFSAGLEPVLQSWLSKSTPAERRGTVFGWAGTARAIGWLLAPLVSGLGAAAFSVRAVFLAGSLLFFALAAGVRRFELRSSALRP